MRTDFAGRLLAWYDSHGRQNLPWQLDRSVYRVWISEIMLQQTQVSTVIPYFERFVRRFPDVVVLADADVDDVLHHWSGLGYYARARNLHRAARIVRDEHAGDMPQDFDVLLGLPGIGRSTAGAILSIACGQRHPILDGNVKRVLARHAAVAGWPGETAVATRLWELSGQRTPARRVGDYTQAIMDLGATLCTRTKPACGHCPVRDDCVAFATGRTDLYPGRKPKKHKPLRDTTMVLAVAGDAVLLERRPASGIWGGLWSLPEVGDLEAWCIDRFGAVPTTERWSVLRHSFSHYDLDIRPVVVRIGDGSRKVADDADQAWYRPDEIPPGGIAAPVRKLIDALNILNDVTNG